MDDRYQYLDPCASEVPLSIRSIRNQCLKRQPTRCKWRWEGGVKRTTTGGQLSTFKGQEKDREMASGEDELFDVQINRDDTICSDSRQTWCWGIFRCINMYIHIYMIICIYICILFMMYINDSLRMIPVAILGMELPPGSLKVHIRVPSHPACSMSLYVV